MQQPLAYRMRPRLDEVVGQQHLVGPGKIIRRMVEAKMLFHDPVWSTRDRKNKYR